MTRIAVDNEKLRDFCRRNHIRRLAFFGSVIRDDFGPTSDIDVLVEFEPGKTPSFFRLFDMEDDLSDMFEGRKVELRTPQDLSQYFRDDVLAHAEVHFAQE